MVFPLIGLISTFGFAPQALANSAPSNECALSGVTSGSVPACPYSLGGGSLTSLTAITTDGTCSGATFCGTKSDPGSAVTPINAWSVCRWVDNNTGVNGASYFVPFKSATEWTAFRNNHPQPALSLVTCAEPFASTGAPATVSVSPPYSACSTVNNVANPNVFGRTGFSTWPNPAINDSFTCVGGATTISSALQWTAGNADGMALGQLSWNQHFTFSPNLVFTSTDTTTGGPAGTNITINTGDSVLLSYSVSSPYGSISSSSPTGWSGFSGAIINPVEDSTYKETVTDSNGLTSVATVTITVNGQCGAAASGGALTAPPSSNLCIASDNLTSPVVGNSSNNGWTWGCTPSGGGLQKSCNVALEAAACTPTALVVINADGSTTSTLCSAGDTASTISVASGNYSYSCTSGSGAVSSTANCSGAAFVPAPINCPPTSVSWTLNGNTCTGTTTGTTTTGTDSLAVSSTAVGTTGSAQFLCTNGTFGSALPGATCTPAAGSCPAINFSSEGDAQWSFPTYCGTNGAGNFDDPGFHLIDDTFMECDWPNWPKISGIDAAGWAGLNFPGPPGYTASLAATTPPLPGYVSVGDPYDSPLFPYVTIRNLDNAAGVVSYPTYPGQQTQFFQSGYPMNWSQFPYYTPDDPAITNAADGSVHSELSDLVNALYNAIAAPVSMPLINGQPIFLACDSLGGDYYSSDPQPCLQFKAQFQANYGATGQLYTYTYPNGDSWSFQISGQDPNGGCFYDADHGVGWADVMGSGGSHAYKYVGSPSAHKIGHCDVKVWFTRPPGTTNCGMSDGMGGVAGGLPNNPYCGGAYVYPVGGHPGPGKTCVRDQSLDYPQSPNTSSSEGPQVCGYDCESGQ